MADDTSTLELISSVSEFEELHDFMEDTEIDTALAKIIKLCAKPDVPPATAARLVIELQAVSAKFAVLATFYQSIGKKGTTESHKKNVYFTMRDATAKLADALKYAARNDR